VQKFIWPLQRLLDVKSKQEDALRTELMALTEQIASLRSRIMMEKIVLRDQMDELSGLASDQRMNRQQEFMLYVHVKDALIQRLSREQEQVEQQRQKKINDLLAIRKFRKGLERLRVRAREDYDSRMNRLEQNQLDENTSIVFARRMAAQLK
jgi:flagellar export protein FliJ